MQLWYFCFVKVSIIILHQGMTKVNHQVQHSTVKTSRSCQDMVCLHCEMSEDLFVIKLRVCSPVIKQCHLQSLQASEWRIVQHTCIIRFLWQYFLRTEDKIECWNCKDITLQLFSVLSPFYYDHIFFSVPFQWLSQEQPVLFVEEDSSVLKHTLLGALECRYLTLLFCEKLLFCAESLNECL